MTIASEIQRIQTNIANAYDAAEAKGATMPVTENSDNLATTIASITGGGAAIELTAQSYVPQLLNTDDKVWVNNYYYAENSSRNVAPLGNSYLASACVLPTPDSQVYFLWSANSNLSGGVYRFGNKITNQWLTLPKVVDWWGGCFVELGRYSQGAVYNIAIHTPTARYAYTNNYTQGYGAVYNAQWLYHWNNGVIDAIREINVGDGTYNDVTVANVPANSFTASSACERPAVSLENYILIVCSNTTAILLENDWVNSVYNYVRTVSISGLSSSVMERGFYGVTTDNKYLMIDNYGLYLGDVTSGGNITTKTFNSIPGNNVYHFMTNGDSSTIISNVNSLSSATPIASLYSWNGSEGEFTDLSISSTDDRRLIGVGQSGNVQVFATKSGTTYDTEISYPNAMSGYYLSSFSDATVDTVTGKAKGYFWYFGIGLVTVLGD